MPYGVMSGFIFSTIQSARSFPFKTKYIDGPQILKEGNRNNFINLVHV